MTVKICGAGSVADVAAVAAGGADLVGLWHGVPGGRAEISRPELELLADAARRTGSVEPVLVTFISDPERLRAILAATGIRRLQLHGYQPPALVRSLKQSVAVTVLKVLHVAPSGCAEHGLLDAYQRAGTDFFLLDTVTGPGRIGSTGERIPPPLVLDLADRLPQPFLLAGGLSPERSDEYLPVLAHPRFHGVDVDTGARDPDGRISRQRVRSIVRSWHPDHRKALS